MKMNKEHQPCAAKSEDHLYKIGMFASMNQITVKALRFYEEQGILIPAFVDEESGYRYYTIDQMSTIHQITALKLAGFTLDDIKRINTGAAGDLFLNKKKQELLSKIAKLTEQIAIIDGYLLDKESSLDNPVLIKTIPAQKVAAMRRTITSYDDIFELMPQMGAKMEECGCECSLPEYCFVQYLEEENEEGTLIEACEAVTKLQKDAGELRFYEIEEMTCACIFHKGSYNELPKSYASVLKYIEDNDYDICGPIREFHIDGIWNKDSIDEWLTQIQIPVTKK